ncbi:MAG: stage V sporulation protein AC [Velocimicrobium sp.]
MKEKTKISDVLKESDEKRRNKKYNQYVKDVTPTHNMLVNLLNAYWVGGLICVIGQFLINWFMSMGVDKESAGAYNILILVGLSVLLTGLQIYPKIAKMAGAGTIVPITGFANSVAASAIEFKKEGQVFGIGCKIFTIAGPVILYGIFSSWILGLIYWILKVT